MKNILLLTTIAIYFISHELATASSVTIAWNPSTSSNVAGYYVYYTTTNGQSLNQVDAGNSSTETFSNLQAGVTYNFAITAYDSFGDESAYSSQINYLVPGILTISPGTSPRGSKVIQFPIAPGHWYDLQSAGTLQNWQSLWQTGVAVSNIWQSYIDTAAANVNIRFYRVVSH